MNYIYDILLNFNKKIYDIYEWEKNDIITHIRKIPLFIVEKKQLLEIVNNEVIFNQEKLKKIENKTEIFTKNNVEHLNYCMLLCDLEEVIALKINNNGEIDKISKLLFDEEMEVIEYGESLPLANLEYKINGKRKKDNYKTRSEYYIQEYIFKEIKKLIKNNNYEKLQYLYLECFNKPLNDINNVINEIEKNWENVYLKFYNLLKITTAKR